VSRGRGLYRDATLPDNLVFLFYLPCVVPSLFLLCVYLHCFSHAPEIQHDIGKFPHARCFPSAATPRQRFLSILGVRRLPYLLFPLRLIVLIFLSPRVCPPAETTRVDRKCVRHFLCFHCINTSKFSPSGLCRAGPRFTFRIYTAPLPHAPLFNSGAPLAFLLRRH